MCIRDSQIIILSEGVHSPVLDQYPAVYKYQSSEKVIREVMACYGVENGVDTSPALLPKKEMRIIGIYSPVGRTQMCIRDRITASDMGVKLYTDFGFVHNGNFMQYKL